MKPARLRRVAKQDLCDAAVHCAGQGGLALGEDFLREAAAALSRIEAMPVPGSPRAGQLCGVEGLRAWPVKRVPLRWFYFERDSHLDVVRLLGGRQDIAAMLVSLDATDVQCPRLQAQLLQAIALKVREVDEVLGQLQALLAPL